MSTTNVKIPVELLDHIRQKYPGTPGEALQKIVDEYERLEAFADMLPSGSNFGSASARQTGVAEKIQAYMTLVNGKLETFDKAIDELKTMLMGLKIAERFR